jgi:2-C-methyl-D-erythritol 4-phosphate cytidylyltransferase
MKRKVIIVAGGKGTRMLSEIPKQFLKIGNEPVLIHTLKRFYSFSTDIEIILVLPENEITQWKKICKEYKFEIPHKLAYGGSTRFQSVKNGVRNINEPCLVAVHDGVRPLVSSRTIKIAFKIAAEKGNAVPAIKIEPSIRFITNEKNKTVDRNQYRIIQTPQVFQSNLLKKAYQQDFQDSFTDDASVVENTGVDINLVEGNPENIKITTKKDLRIAEALLNSFE